VPLAERATAAARRLIPYAIAVAALGWVFHRMDLGLVRAALARAPLGRFVAFSAAILFCNLAADTFAMHSVFRWFGCRVRYRDLVVVRAATYLLAVINYHVGQAAIVGYLYRRKRVPLLTASGWILFIIGINVGTLFLLASIGASRATGALAPLRLLPVATAVGAALYAAILVVRPRVLFERELLRPLFQMGVLGHLKGIGVRLPHIFVLICWYYFSFHMFGIEVTPIAALIYLPAYFAVSSLPVSPNGIGLPQVVAMFFFAPFYRVPAGIADTLGAQKAAVMAACLSAQIVSTAAQLVFGMVCLRRATTLGVSAEAPGLQEPAPAPVVANARTT
jgi:hypothetical protein